MLTIVINSWTRYREADRRQLPLFPEWERARWLAPLPSLGAAVMLMALVAVGTPWTAADVTEPLVALRQPAAPSEELEEPAEPEPEYDLAAIPDHIKAAAKRHRLSEELITAVIAVESNFDHAAVSHKGAQGLMQLMPQTAALMGVKDPHAPDENIDAGASHLRAMLDTFNGDLPLALAAYNAGQQNVVRYRGIPPFPETRRFVARVLRRMGDKKAAERVVTRPIPAPQWVSRSQPKVQVASAPSLRPLVPRPAVVSAAAPRTPERASQLVLHEPEQRPSSRTWSAAPVPVSAPIPVEAPAAPPPGIPEPSLPFGQAP